MEYNFSDIEQKWQKAWEEAGVYSVSNESDKPHYYVLDMFPYPSGAGLHVGHPLGYIASDIYSRYKRLKGFNVLHPMGFDSYGLPAEQYAIQTGTHPEETTYKNIARYIEQLKKIGFCYDWNREVRTCDPKFYKWTQWAFVQMFNSYFDPKTQKAHDQQTDRRMGSQRPEMGDDERERAAGTLDELSYRLPGRYEGQLVSGFGNGACQR